MQLVGGVSCACVLAALVCNQTEKTPDQRAQLQPVRGPWASGPLFLSLACPFSPSRHKQLKFGKYRNAASSRNLCAATFTSISSQTHCCACNTRIPSLLSGTASASGNGLHPGMLCPPVIFTPSLPLPKGTTSSCSVSTAASCNLLANAPILSYNAAHGSSHLPSLIQYC